MKKLLKELQLLFGNTPTSASFDAKLKTFEEPLRRECRLKLCRLAFGYYDNLPGPFRKYVDKYLKHDRELYIDYLLHHTPLGKLRYTLHNPDLFTCSTSLKKPVATVAPNTIRWPQASYLPSTIPTN